VAAISLPLLSAHAVTLLAILRSVIVRSLLRV
jgi:hypothetical protein